MIKIESRKGLTIVKNKYHLAFSQELSQLSEEIRDYFNYIRSEMETQLILIVTPLEHARTKPCRKLSPRTRHYHAEILR